MSFVHSDLLLLFSLTGYDKFPLLDGKDSWQQDAWSGSSLEWQHLFFKSHTLSHFAEKHRVFQKLMWMHPPSNPTWPQQDLCQWAPAARAQSQNLNVLHHQRVLFGLSFFFFPHLCEIRTEANGGQKTSTMTVLAYVWKSLLPILFIESLQCERAAGQRWWLIVQPLRVFQLNNMQWYEAALEQLVRQCGKYPLAIVLYWTPCQRHSTEVKHRTTLKTNCLFVTEQHLNHSKWVVQAQNCNFFVFFLLHLDVPFLC